MTDRSAAVSDLREILGDRYVETIRAAVLADNPDAIRDAQLVGGNLGQLMYLSAVDRLHRVIATVLPDLLKNPRDEYHTMEELYHYRMLYNALAANALPDLSCKSWRHSDGGKCFGGGWFVVYMTLPSGQVSNHYRAEHWELFHVPEVERAPEYDGHTPQEAAERLRQAARDGLPAVTPDLMARAWDEGLKVGVRSGYRDALPVRPENPYRTEGDPS